MVWLIECWSTTKKPTRSCNHASSKILYVVNDIALLFSYTDIHIVA